MFNMGISHTPEKVKAISSEINNSVEESVDNFKNSYNVDYSLCVTNLDKYLEEIM